MNLFKIAENLHQSLAHAGIRFTRDGYPVIPKEMILQEYPDEMVPFEHRNACKNPHKTVLTHFSNDELLYRRLRHIDEDIEICKTYMGVVGFDLSPRLGWNIEQQRFNLLINQMVNAYRAINGVRILPNFRIGDITTISALDSFPANSLYAVGALGCSKGYAAINTAYLNAKLLYKRPDGLLVYGKLMPQYKAILDEFGITYRVYEDFKSMCYRRRMVS
ncbi:MAG: DUF4417 domain-containing protein [Eubacteriales bacterium]